MEGHGVVSCVMRVVSWSCVYICVLVQSCLFVCALPIIVPALRPHYLFVCSSLVLARFRLRSGTYLLSSWMICESMCSAARRGCWKDAAWLFRPCDSIRCFLMTRCLLGCFGQSGWGASSTTTEKSNRPTNMHAAAPFLGEAGKPIKHVWLWLEFFVCGPKQPPPT